MENNIVIKERILEGLFSGEESKDVLSKFLQFGAFNDAGVWEWKGLEA